MNFTLPDNMSEMPTGYEGFTFEDVKKCPIFQINKKVKKDPDYDSEAEPSSDEEEEEPKGGCPVMSNKRNKNPGFDIPECGHNIPYVSPVAHLLNNGGVFDIKQEMTFDQWDNYPIYLKHTIFHTGGDIERTRELEIGHRFFVQDGLRERGNKRFAKGHYTMALKHYNLALSTMRWLDCKVDMNEDPYDTSRIFKDWKKKYENSKDVQNFVNNNFTKIKIDSII